MACPFFAALLLLLLPPKPGQCGDVLAMRRSSRLRAHCMAARCVSRNVSQTQIKKTFFGCACWCPHLQNRFRGSTTYTEIAHVNSVRHLRSGLRYSSQKISHHRVRPVGGATNEPTMPAHAAHTQHPPLLFCLAHHLCSCMHSVALVALFLFCMACARTRTSMTVSLSRFRRSEAACALGVSTSTVSRTAAAAAAAAWRL